MPVTPIINGTQYGWSNISVILFGTPVVGILKIDYKAKQKKENLYGQGIYAVGRGYGNVEYDASLKLYLLEWRKIIAASPNKDPLQIGPFDISVQFGGTRVTAITDVLRSCEFMDDVMNADQGSTKIEVDLPLIIGSIEHK